MDKFTKITERYQQQARRAGVTFGDKTVSLGVNSREEQQANYHGSDGTLNSLGAKRHIKMLKRRKLK